MVFSPSLIKIFSNDTDMAWFHYLIPLILITELPSSLAIFSFTKIFYLSLSIVFLIELASFLGLIFLPSLFFGMLLLNKSIGYWFIHFCLMLAIIITISLLNKRKDDRSQK